MNNPEKSSRMEICTLVTLYRMENETTIKAYFDELYDKLVQSFNDETFLATLRAMKGRAIRTVAIPIPFKDNKCCFISKIWFNVQHSSSAYWEGYYVGIGVSFTRHNHNPFPFPNYGWHIQPMAASNRLEKKSYKLISKIGFVKDSASMYLNHAIKKWRIYWEINEKRMLRLKQIHQKYKIFSTV